MASLNAEPLALSPVTHTNQWDSYTHPWSFSGQGGEGSDSNGVFIDYDFSFGLLLWLDSVV